jgi:hypothetical protein
MNRFRLLVVLVLFLIAGQPGLADDRAKLVGIWKLKSIVGEFQDTGEKSYDWGKNPTGYMVYTSDGRQILIIESEGRKPPKTDEDRATLFKTMFAWTGIYRFDGDKIITKIDVSWNPAMNNTEFVRRYKLEGDQLTVPTDWGPSTRFPGRTTRGVFTWERVK